MLFWPEGERKVKVKMFVFDIVLILRLTTVTVVYKYMRICVYTNILFQWHTFLCKWFNPGWRVKNRVTFNIY